MRKVGFKKFIYEENAATIAEYAILLALIVLICILAIRAVGEGAADFWGSSAAELNGKVTSRISS